MKQCDYCGNYGEGIEDIFIDCYYTDGSGETIGLCVEHLPQLRELYPPCPDQDYRDQMQANQADIAENHAKNDAADTY